MVNMVHDVKGEEKAVMLMEKTNRFWKAGLIERNKKTLLFTMITRWNTRILRIRK